MKLAYPAIFTFCKEDNSYSVEFPDLPGCVSGGFSLLEAMEMGIDAASGWILSEIEEGGMVPAATDIKAVKTENADSFVNLLVLDMDAYGEKYSAKHINKNVSIPQWVNALGEKHNADFSKVLQEALIEKYAVPV
ncbi:type II toxin-antitoxin system HicB family antitoxin [Treponema sp. OMZ 840]|uniref:type II toxin-antitoxin system HicB family antitoxin n=1 Tax=Treponema sp. OMZ 840 TaxID=244313 RepID=UPI003D906393